MNIYINLYKFKYPQKYIYILIYIYIYIWIYSIQCTTMLFSKVQYSTVEYSVHPSPPPQWLCGRLAARQHRGTLPVITLNTLHSTIYTEQCTVHCALCTVQSRTLPVITHCCDTPNWPPAAQYTRDTYHCTALQYRDNYHCTAVQG